MSYTTMNVASSAARPTVRELSMDELSLVSGGNDEFDSGEFNGRVFGAAAAGVAVGAGVGSLVPGAGTVVGGAIGGLSAAAGAAGGYIGEKLFG